MTIWCALIRGIGGATHRKMPMAALREAAAAAGLSDPRTVLSTGNLIFGAEGGRAAVERRVADLIGGFGLTGHPAVLRDRAGLARAMRDCPFPDAAEARPSKLLIHFLAAPAADGAEVALRDRAAGERVAVAGDTLWIDFTDGVARSPLTPARIERAVGCTATARNWTTTGKLLAAM